MFTLISSMHRLHIAIFISCIVLASSNGIDSRYTTCSSALLSCGNVYSDVGYPFWGDGRPMNCGHPALQLQCLNNEKDYYPTLKMGQEDKAPYRVLSLKTYHHNITLQLRGLENTSCNSYKKGFSEVFKISPSVENLTLLYNCPRSIDLHSRNLHGSAPCFTAPTTLTTAYYLKNTTARTEYESCSSFQVPVFRKPLDLYNKGIIGQLTDVFYQGFEVIYEYSSQCLNCNNTRGVCGSGSSLPDSDFECFYKDEHEHNKLGKRKLILGIGLSGGLILLALNIGICYYQRFKLRSTGLLSRIISTNPRILDLETGGSFNGIPVFPFSELQEATNNFDETKELGDGGFGVVYYGKLRDGREVAVKRLYEKNYKQVGQFKNEVEILTLLRHPNLVTLYGCTSRHSRELLLVYEYISNGTVADHLHGDRSESEALTWAIRMKIAIETASALAYLHTSDIIHRDVKTNNILLTETFSVKVADFGLSRLFPVDATHVSTVPQGTPGYLDPDYHKCYQVTNKSDVYSFGVVLVELISSLPAVDIGRQEDEINLSDYAVNRIRRGVIHELVDQNLGYKSDFKVKRMVTLVAELAFRCLQQEKEVRPNMNEVLETLLQFEGLDYEALEAEEMDEKRTSVAIDDDIEHPPPSPSSDNWAVKSTTSNPSS